jgi:crotonobetainyl-CoA:carnitine CoA-transferase CaiB-like acyl-CoA transferase
MRTAFKKKTLAEWEAELGDLDICWGRVQSLNEVLDDPLFRERKMVIEIEGQDGQKSRTLGIPVKLSDTPGAVRTPPADFGANTAAILEELGYTPEEIKTLGEKGAI